MTSFGSRSLLAGLLAGAVQFGALGFAFADTTILNVSYDPTRELYKEFNAAFAAHVEGRDRRDRDDPAVAWRLGQAGPRRDRRPRRRRGDAGARRRHRRHRQEVRQDPRRLARRACRTTPRPTPRPSCSWSARAIRRASTTGAIWSRTASQVITPNPKTSGGARWNYLAAWAWANKPVRRRRGQDQGIHRRRSSRTCPVLDTGARGSTDDLRPARASATCCSPGRTRPILALDEFGADKFDIVVPAVLDPGRAAGRGGRRAMSTPRAPRKVAEAYLELPLLGRGPDASPPSTTTARPSRSWSPADDLAKLPEARADHHRRSDLRRLGEGAAQALRRRRHLRPDLQAGPVSCS